MDDKEFHQLLEFLGFSRQGYRKVRKGVKKRVVRHMQGLDCRNMREYLDKLEQSEDVRSQCVRVMSVSISRFFRDKRLWQVLESRILPELIETHRKRVKVWSAGCACGEEAYSLKILWDHMGRTIGKLPVIDITATDINPLYLKRAKDALYPLSSLKEIPGVLRATYFQTEHGGKRFRVKPSLRAGIIWLTHNFFSGPPESGFQLILMRNNLLTYYQDKLIGPILDVIINTLSVGGYVIIGSHEKLSFQTPALQPCPSLSYAFKKEMHPARRHGQYFF